MAENQPGGLDGLRVLDLTDEQGHLAGRILADLGAEVIKIEPPGGDPARQRGPFIGGAPHPDRGVQWLARNAGKHSLVLDLQTAAGIERLQALVRDADVMIESYAPGHLDKLGIGYTDLARINPRLVLCSITPFGQSGPMSHARASDLTVVASSGNLYMTGDADRAPLRCTLPVSLFHGGAEAAAGIAMALWHRDRTGQGQHVDVSLQETMMVTTMSHPSQAWVLHYRGQRSGGYNRVGETIQREIWPCKDGYVSFALRGGPARIPGLIAMVKYMDEHGMATPVLKDRDWKTHNHNRLTQAEVDAIAEPIAAFFRTKTMRELYAAACERNLMLAPANTEREVLDSRQLAAREFFGAVRANGSAADGLRYPVHFANWSLTRVRDSVPALDRQVKGFSGSHGYARPRRTPEPAAGAGIYAGLKVLEFGAGAAAPLATRYFGDQGATVIKIESRQRPDFLRVLRDDGSGKYDASLFFAILNCNKLSAGLNLRDPRGVELARRLIAWADVVIENFAPGVMQKWGFDYDTLKAKHPGLIMVSTCLWGQTGPERAYPGFGGQGAALSGYNYLTGWPDREPLGPFGTITDSLSPRFAATAIAAALLRRERTGEGTYIDVSQVETGVYCATEWLLAYEATQKTVGRLGNRSLDAAPHGVFPTAGEDRWIALAIHTDADWKQLRVVLGEPAWAAAKELDTVAGRLRQADLIEAKLAEWTASQSAEALAARCREAGLDAAVVEDMQDLLNDPQLAHRGHFQQLNHPVIGDHVVEANGLRFSASPHVFARPAPCLAADSAHVYRDIIGISQAELDELTAAGVLS